MAIGNLGVVKNLLEGYVASEFNPGTTGKGDNGLALLPEMVERIASRAELTQANLRVTRPILFDGTNDVDVEAGAGVLIAVVAQSLAAQAEDAVLKIYETNTVTEGTTRDILSVNVNAGGTQATSEVMVVVLPTPMPFAALSWSVVDNGSDGDGEGTGLGDASGVRVMLVYAE